jgi:hypothetical protein
LRQEGCNTADASTVLVPGADIACTSQFLFLIQHGDAGVNEWLMIRNSHSEIFKWLPIGRVDDCHGSVERSLNAPDNSGTGFMGAIKGDIGAIRAITAAAVFSPQGRGSKEDATSAPERRRISPFLTGGSLPPRYRLYVQQKFSCNLNEMRSNHGSPDWRARP